MRNLLVWMFGGLLLLSQPGWSHHDSKANNISVISYGATGNGVTDDTTAIKAAITAARTLGKTLYFPMGTYNVSQELDVTGIRAVGEGSSSNIHGTLTTGFRPLNILSASATPSYIGYLGVTSAITVRDDYSSSIYVGAPADKWSIDHVNIAGGVVGIKNEGGSDGFVTSNTVSSTLADCIYNSHKAQNVIVENNTTTDCGDDTISVVSYISDGAQVDNVLIKNNHALGTNKARGIVVVGGKDVTIESNDIANTLFAGIYVAAEPSYQTFGDNNILVQNNTITNVGSPANGHGGFFINANQNPPYIIDHVLFQNNIINSSNYDGIRAQYTGTMSNVAFLSNKINNYASQAFRFLYYNNNTLTNFYCQNNTANGAPIVPPAFNSDLCLNSAPNFTVTGSSLGN